MIAFIDGIVEEKQPMRVVLNAGGVGYEIHITLNTYEDLPLIGKRARVITYHHVREDAELLYGFSRAEERQFFEQLLAVSGIGPTTAIGILSGLPLVSLRAAIVAEDVKRLSSIKGVGKKTAERIIVELKDRISDLVIAEDQTQTSIRTGDKVLNDAVLALVALGYRNADAYASVKRVLSAAGADVAVEDVVRRALSGLQQ
ncbi:MAG: Holliday junction branch migration protein RuvA [bacterium]|nr:Holliday junction branch migration protein RuvA [bacterium]